MSESKEIKGQYTYRALALQVLYAATASERNPEEVLEELCKAGGFRTPERDSLAWKLIAGVGENSARFLPLVEQFSENWPIDRISVLTKLILSMAFWELENKTAPDIVVVDQALELSKCFAEEDSFRFINGVLDRYLKSKKSV